MSMDDNDLSLKILSDMRKSAYLKYHELLYTEDYDDRLNRDFYLHRWTGFNIAIRKITGNLSSDWLVQILHEIDEPDSPLDRQ